MSSDSNNQQSNEIREVAHRILERAKSDPNYLEQLKSDPEATLAREGLSGPVVTQLIGEFGLVEVEGYCDFTCDYSCNTGTCQLTYCAHIPQTGGPMETQVVGG
ncbi:MAG: hypothetical protein WCD37_11970 [Chloroflexia bacterium]